MTGLYEYDQYANPEQIVKNRYRYDLWGMPEGNVTEAVDNPLRFKARIWDEDTELYDFRNRWYDPEIGRFISEDPIGLAGGINVYRFVGNNPVHGWDPYGLSDPDPCPFPVSAESLPLVGPYLELANDLHSLAETGFRCGVELEPLSVPGGPLGVPIPAGPQGSPLPLGGNKSAPGAGPGPSSSHGEDTESLLACTAREGTANFVENNTMLYDAARSSVAGVGAWLGSRWALNAARGRISSSPGIVGTIGRNALGLAQKGGQHIPVAMRGGRLVFGSYARVLGVGALNSATGAVLIVGAFEVGLGAGSYAYGLGECLANR